MSTDPYILEEPATLSAPIVLGSPHSGRTYPDDMVAMSQLPSAVMRSSEDAYVEELLAIGPSLGLPLLIATYPRA